MTIQDKYKVKGKKEPTHSQMSGGKYYVPQSKLKTFYKDVEKEYGLIYPDIVELVKDKNHKFFLDVDDENVDIDKIIEDVDDILKMLYKNDLTKIKLKRNNKNKFHIIYNLFLPNGQVKYILDLLKSKYEDTYNIIDKSVYNTGLRLPNSLKKGEKDSLYSPKFDKDYSLLLPCQDAEITQNFHDFLVNEHIRLEKEKEEEQIRLEKERKEQQEKKQYERDISQKKDFSIEKCHKLLQCLNVERFRHYENCWRDIMFILKNIGDKLKDEEGCLKLLLEFSKKVPEKYDYQKVLSAWNSTTPKMGGLFIGTLKRMAKNDNKEMYDKIHESFVYKISQHDIAEFIYNKYKNDFVYTNNPDKNDRWVHFNGDKWVSCFEGNVLFKLIPTEIYNIYKKEVSNIEEDDVDMGKKAKILKTVEKLKSYDFIVRLMNMLKKFFLDESFLKKADQNTKLIGFENGVYDLNIHKFRKQKREDYVTMSVGYNYVEEDDEEIQKKIDDFMISIMPDEEERDYLLYNLASCLEGGNNNEVYPNFEGTGGNGKGTETRKMEYTLGDYAGSLDVEFLTSDRKSSSNHNTALYECMKKRFVMCSEPSKNAKLNAELVKELTGGDEISVRQIYGKAEKMKPHFTLFMQCNKLPEVDDDSEGTWRRFQLIKFRESFRGDKANVNLKNEMKDWRMQNFKLLAKYYKKYVENDYKIEIPQKLKDEKNEFKKGENVIHGFIDECLEKEEGGIIKSKDLYERFKEYLTEEGIKRHYKKKDFNSLIELNLGIPLVARKKINGVGYKSIYLNYKLKEDNDEEVDDVLNALDLSF